MTRLLITGATGFTGRHACAYYTAKGWHVLGVTHDHMTTGGMTETCAVELTDPHAVREVVQTYQPDYILHLAGQNSVRTSWHKPLETIQTNVLGTLHLLEAVKACDVPPKVLIITSALGQQNENFLHPYSLSKRWQSMAAKAWYAFYDVPALIASPVNLIGPGESTGVCAVLAQQIVNALENQTIAVSLSSPNVHRAFLDVRDAIRAYDTLLVRGEAGHYYPLSSEKAVSLQEIVNYFSFITDRLIHVKATGTWFEAAPFYSTEALRQLGWHQKRSFHSSLDDTFNYWLEKKKEE